MRENFKYGRYCKKGIAKITITDPVAAPGVGTMKCMEIKEIRTNKEESFWSKFKCGFTEDK